MRQVLAHVLNNDNSLRLDEKGNPIPKHFTEIHWEQIKKFNDPKFKFIKFLDEISKGKIINVKAKIIEPIGTNSEPINVDIKQPKMTKELEKQGKSVKIFIENLEYLTIDELKLFLNDSRKTIIKLAKEQIEKLS